MQKKRILFLAEGLFILAAIQWFGPDRTNPPVIKTNTVQSHLRIPPRVADILDRACMDCHSNETRWPWYSRVAPVSWWVVGNVNIGRRTLNLSEWTQYKPPYAIATLGAMNNAVREEAMPLDCYQQLHPQARLTKDERKIFCDWAQGERSRLEQALFQFRRQTPKP